MDDSQSFIVDSLPLAVPLALVAGAVLFLLIWLNFKRRRMMTANARRCASIRRKGRWPATIATGGA
ncbi:hypothetical protein [Nocardiopsis tropica]|uniref:PEP-CTERM protein-sorting domain-containing protein n=1 Tax=Nocardiopsis tropica TaxID=109330 RepID=A0ABU7KK59_9ACTN|nr:hypothetical protein [Nocardiopsis umidischolae]MEE2049663.1 hypothetical protein [Nocardiopsis umidischolae]